VIQVWNIILKITVEEEAKRQSLIYGAIFSAFEKKLNEAETEKFNIKQMKDMFEQKAAQLATEIVG